MKEDPRVKEILARFDRMKDIRSKVEPLWQDCVDYALPNRATWNEDGEEGRRPSIRLYDSRANSDVKTMVNGFLGSMVPRSMPFFRLQISDKRLKDAFGVADWLEEVQEYISDELRRGLFYEGLQEITPDGFTVGLGHLFIKDNVEKGQTEYLPRHYMECYIERDGGPITGHASLRRVSIAELAKEFGEEALGEETRKLIEQGRTDTKIKCLHLVVERAGVERAPLSAGTSKPLASYYINYDAREMIHEGGFDSMPWITWLHTMNSGQTYPSSPVMDALGTIMMGNQMNKTMVNLGNRIADPPIAMDEQMKDTASFVPGGRAYFKKNMDPPQPMVFGANYPVAKDAVMRNDQLISDHLHTNFFLLLQRAWDSGKARTATEIMEMMGEKATVLSPLIGNFESQVLTPTIMRTAQIMERRGALPPPPRALMGARPTIKIEYIGPMAMAAKKYFKQSGIRAGLEMAFQILKIDPKTIVRINTDRLMKEALENVEMPAAIIRDDDEVAEIQQNMMDQAAAQQEQMLQLEQSKQLMGNVDKLNQPVAPGSMLEAMGEQAVQQGVA